MNTQRLIQEAKARFKHSESKIYLTEKYQSRLTFAHGGGMWNATTELMSFLSSSPQAEVVLLDNFGNPVLVNTSDLLGEAWTVYNNTMGDWYREYLELN